MKIFFGQNIHQDVKTCLKLGKVFYVFWSLPLSFPRTEIKNKNLFEMPWDGEVAQEHHLI